MKRLILAVIAVFLFLTPAFSYDSQLSPTEDTFTDKFYLNQAMGDEGGAQYKRLWAGPVIDMEVAEELLADGTPTGHYIPGIGAEFTHTYIKFDLSSVSNHISEAKLWLYRTADEWGYSSTPGNGNPDTYPPPVYKDNPTYEYDKDGTHWYKYNDPDEGTIKVYYETNNGWSEGTLKWKDEASGPNFSNNTEGSTTQIGPEAGWYHPNNCGWVSWDVTSFVQQALGTQDKILSLVLANDETPYQTFHLFYSSEGEDAAKRPYLGINLIHPSVSSTTYNHSTRRLSITFDETINVSTFTATTLGNLSIQDGTTTVDLDGATIITTQNSTLMEATLSAADGAALNAIKQNTLRLVVDASCGIKDLYNIEPASNTYATSTYSVSNTSITGTLKDAKSSSVIADATVKLYNAAGTLQAQATSDANGNFTLNANVPDGNYNLVITKLPLFKEKTQTLTITASTPLDAGTLLIDPYGIVYDSVTGRPISGATVTLYTSSGTVYTGCPEPNPQSSRGDGSYNFNVAPGTYYLGAVKDGYADYTSATFTVTTEIVEWNIPMIANNRSSSTYLSISKQANKKAVTAGDIITYTIDINNVSNSENATGTTINDTLPAGFKYILGSTTVDDIKASDPAGTHALSWSLGTLSTLTAKKLKYRVQVGTEARLGKNENSAIVSATMSVSGSATSAGPSISTVEVREGLFSDSGFLLGKVFEDINGNGIQDNYEPGIPKISLIMEDGTVIVTDAAGRYSVPNITKGTHVIRLDQRVLPGGPFVKAKPQEEAPAKETMTQKIPAREALLDQRRLDTWRKDALGQNQPQLAGGEKQLAPSPAMIKKKALQLPVAESTPRINAYSYYGKNKDRQNVMGMLEASSEAEVAEILHGRNLEIISIAKVEEEEDATVQAKEEIKENTVAQEVAAPVNPPRYPQTPELEGQTRGQYRSDIPKESKFFKIYGSETVKVNFPVKLLTAEEAKIEAEKDKAENQFMLVGLADATVGYLNGKGKISNLESSNNSPYKDEFYEDGKVKLYVKGLVKGEYLLTAALDTDKKDNQHLFEYVNPEKYYPIYGDQSSYFNETDSRGKFYLRVDKDDSYGMWGNYTTQEFTRTEFGRYNRTLAGAKSHIGLKDKAQGDFFYALSTQEQTSETFSAKGISGPFWLGHTSLLEYSDSIRIETRDKDRPDIVLSTRPMAREVDYEIDYDSGRIFFKEPISTTDENDDPNYIVADYEFVPLSGETKYYLTGSRLQTKLFNDKVTLGGQLIAENHPANNPRLYGFDTVLQPDPSTRLAAEWDYSTQYLDSDNRSFLKSDNAWKIEGAKVMGKLNLQSYYSDLGNRFRNPVNITEKGLEKYGATADYQLTPATNIVFDHWRNLSTIARTFDRESSLDIYHKKENYFLGAGYAFWEYKDKGGLTPDKDIDEVNLKAGRKLTRKLIATIEEEYKNEEQSGVASALDNKAYTTTTRMDYRVAGDATIYVKNRLIKELHKEYSNVCGLGLTKATSDGDAYIEYGFGGKTAETIFGLKKEQNINEYLTLSSYMNNRVTGDKNEENVGFGTTYEVLAGLFTKFNFENTRARASAGNYYKQNAQSVAFDYLPAGTKNSYGIKLERRKASTLREINVLGYAKQCLNNEYSLLLNSEFLRELSSQDTIRTNRKAVLGLSYRPVYNDKLNLLSKYEYKGEINHSTSGSSCDYYNNIVSLEGDYQLHPKVDIFSKYALKFQREKDNGLQTDAMIDMTTTRVNYKLTEIFDFTTYYRFINERDNSIIKHAPALEVGVLFLKRLRLGLGYNFLDYRDRDEKSEDYSGIGPYFNLGAKF